MRAARRFSEDPGTLVCRGGRSHGRQCSSPGSRTTENEAKIARACGVPGQAGRRREDLRRRSPKNIVRRHDRAERRRDDGLHRHHLHRAPRPTSEGARRSSKQTAEAHQRRGRRAPTRTSPRSPSSASACATTRASPRKMFETLADEGINIQMISTSEIKISVVDRRQVHRARRAGAARRASALPEKYARSV